MIETTQVSLTKEIEDALLRIYGPMLSGDSLRTALGYPSMEAFRQALSRDSVPVPVFSIKQRRGKFALVRDVAKWLAKQRTDAVADSALPGERPME